MLIHVNDSIKERQQAEEMAMKSNELHKSDALHVILAKNNNAILIARNNHFEEIKNFTKIMKPEEVIFD